MGKAGVNSNGPVTKELAELNCNIQYKSKKIREGVLGEGQGLSKEDGFKVNEDVQDINEGRPEAVQAGQQKTEQQLHGTRVCWEEFLALKSLKVLLVENDDSTRHVVSALLRNCGYEVIAVANGIQAWKILEDDKPHVDLVLSEVVIPCLSGIDLLTKIMDHKTCQNVPVIMMSTHDSMSTVLKCLSKGAVDFLVKPIRKNELKTLWQHIWRKCHSSSGSGSESGIRSQNSTKSTSFEDSDKNTGSNYEDNIGRIALNARDEGDNGSGTEITQVSHSRSEAFGNDGVPAIKTRECEGQDEELDVVMRQDLGIGIGVPRIPYVQLEVPKEKGSTSMADTGKQKFSKIDSMKDDQPLEKGQPELNNEKSNWELGNQAADLMGVTTIRSTDPQMQSDMFHMQNGVSKVPEIKDKVIHGSKEGPSLELSLKTQRDVRDTSFSDHDRNVLRHSDHSAFSRYKFPTASKQAPSGNSPHDNSSEAAQAKSLQDFQSHTNSTPLYQRSNGCSNNNDIGSTMNSFFTNEEACEDKTEPRSTINCLHPSSTFQPEHDRIISLSQPILQGQVDAAVCKKTLSQGRDMNQEAQMQQHHMYNVHQQHQQMSNQGAECGSSKIQGAPMEGDVGHHNLHGNASGSNHSSNGQSGGSSAINSRGTNMESDKGVVGDEGTVNGIGGVSKSGVDENHISHREAALNKFRQKRKDRCFEKKVRYQSRKKLADQRPRVRGQFVRQPAHENKGNDTQCQDHPIS